MRQVQRICADWSYSFKNKYRNYRERTELHLHTNTSQVKLYSPENKPFCFLPRTQGKHPTFQNSIAIRVKKKPKTRLGCSAQEGCTGSAGQQCGTEPGCMPLAPGPGADPSPGHHTLPSTTRAGAALFLLLRGARAVPQHFTNYRKPILKLLTLLPQHEALLL